MIKILSILSIIFSLFAVGISYSNTESGRQYSVYDYELVSTKYKMAKKNNAPDDVLLHIFNRKTKIGGIQSLFISFFSVDGYKLYSKDFKAFKESLLFHK